MASRWARAAALACAMLVALASSAWAEGPQFNGPCASIAWDANSEPDLAGYRLYDRVSLSDAKSLIRTYGPQITSATCASLGLNPGQHYLSMTAFDASGNESTSIPDVPFVIVLNNAVTNLTITAITTTSVTLEWTEVDGGNGLPASYDVRFATPLIDWGVAASVTSGTCTTPVAGTTVGAQKSCTVTGLSLTTPYQFQLVGFSGTLNVNSIFGPLSNIVSGTTGGAVPPATRVTVVSDDFTRANGTLTTPWMVGYTGQQNPTINSNAVRSPSAGGAHALAIYNSTIANDQWAQVLLAAIQGAGTVSATVRIRYANTPTVSGYECRAYRNSAVIRSEIARRVNGSSAVTMAEENTTAWATGDILDCEVQGNTIKLSRISGGTTTLLLTSTGDATFSSGKAGLSITSSVLGDGVLDNFSMGYFAPAVVVADTCGCEQH